MSLTQEELDLIIKLASIPKELRASVFVNSMENFALPEEKLKTIENLERIFKIIDDVIKD